MTASRTFALAAATGLLCLAGWSNDAHAVAKIETADDKNFGIGVLLQPHFRFDLEGSSEGTPGYDPYLRRARILMTAKFTDKVNFFAETDNPNFGKNGDWSGSMFMQDAFVEFNLGPAAQFDVGMLLMPFSHHLYQSAATLLMVDYHGMFGKYAGGSHKVWRDAGVMWRGTAMERRLEWRLSLTNGVETGYNISIAPEDAIPTDASNPYDLPRVVGRVVFNVFESDAGPGAGGFFCDGIYLKAKDGEIISPKKMLTFGASADWQSEGLAPDSDYMAFAADAFWDIPLGDGSSSINGQLDGYMFMDQGMGGFMEFGYRVGFWQPAFAVDFWKFDGDGEVAGDYLSIMPGVNYWWLAHNANLKFNFGVTQSKDGTDADDPFAMYGLLQTQFLF